MTLDRFSHIEKSEIIENWMKDPKVNFDWPLKVTNMFIDKSAMS
jgi:hypothetical protein